MRGRRRRCRKMGGCESSPAVARVTGARHVPGRAVCREVAADPRGTAVIHGGTNRCHSLATSAPDLTQVVNRHDRPSPSFRRGRVDGAVRRARRCTTLRALAAPSTAGAGRCSDTVRQRARVLPRTRLDACLNLKCGLQDRCAVLRPLLVAAVPSGTAAGRLWTCGLLFAALGAPRRPHVAAPLRTSRGDRPSRSGRRDRCRRSPGRRPRAAW